MASWYQKIAVEPTDFAAVGEAFFWFEKQYAEAQKDLDARGMRIEDVAKRMPGNVAFRYQQFSELDAIVGYLEIVEAGVKGRVRKNYIEHYNRALTERQVERYAESDPDVLAVRMLRQQIGLTRDKYTGLIKGYEHMLYQLGNITKLRIAQIDDATL